VLAQNFGSPLNKKQTESAFAAPAIMRRVAYSK
jgi:hypothetical protein